jgi:hypothetical protein
LVLAVTVAVEVVEVAVEVVEVAVVARQGKERQGKAKSLK